MGKTELDDGGPAFPSHGSMGEVAHEGMTIRDWFAGQALCGLIGLPASRSPSSAEFLAKKAYEAADAILAEREKSNGQD
jgi:hypothetical protein